VVWGLAGAAWGPAGVAAADWNKAQLGAQPDATQKAAQAAHFYVVCGRHRNARARGVRGSSYAAAWG